MNNEHLKIQKLNDSFRTSLSGGKVMITRGISLLPSEDGNNIVKQVQSFNSFNKNNDPYGEHDFGVFDFKENRIFGKLIIMIPSTCFIASIRQMKNVPIEC